MHGSGGDWRTPRLVGSSREVGKDGMDGLLAYLKVAAVNQENTTLLLLVRILPMKINTEVKEVKETMSIYEAIADLKACGLDELLAFYLTRYPIGRDERNTEWANMIDDAIYQELIEAGLEDEASRDPDAIEAVFRKLNAADEAIAARRYLSG
jgi:ABC-type antimicrobial peptide transport system permease subunit